jgi:RNA polymerase sigma factor (TIGR02999 family)
MLPLWRIKRYQYQGDGCACSLPFRAHNRGFEESLLSDVTRILQEFRSGRREATDELLAAVYVELRRMAGNQLRQERAGQTLQATALVHEAYLRLAGTDGGAWDNRRHFFSAAAEAMRRILVEAARRKGRLKRGGDRQRQELDETDCVALPDSIDVLALDEALEKLAAVDPQKVQLVKLRFFAGLSVAEAGEIVGVSRATADRYWAFARAWLFNELRANDSTIVPSVESRGAAPRRDA